MVPESSAVAIVGGCSCRRGKLHASESWDLRAHLSSPSGAPSNTSHRTQLRYHGSDGLMVMVVVDGWMVVVVKGKAALLMMVAMVLKSGGKLSTVGECALLWFAGWQ